MTAAAVEDMTEPKTFSSREVEELTGVTYRQIDHWIRRGYLPNDTAHGSGSQRRFTLDELEAIYYAGGLVRAGFTPTAALRIARDLADGLALDVVVSSIVRVTVSTPETAS